MAQHHPQPELFGPTRRLSAEFEAITGPLLPLTLHSHAPPTILKLFPGAECDVVDILKWQLPLACAALALCLSHCSGSDPAEPSSAADTSASPANPAPQADTIATAQDSNPADAKPPTAPKDTDLSDSESVDDSEPSTDTRPDAPQSDGDTSTSPDAQDPATTPHCESYAEGQVTGTLTTGTLAEVSGLAGSLKTPDVFWSHNDSGDSANLFALDTSGVVLTRLILPGIVAIDFEDLDAAACPDGSPDCLWVGDIGNNSHSREQLSVYAVPEPDLDGASVDAPLTAETVWAFHYSYPEDSVDSEALIVRADGGRLWVIEKTLLDSFRVFSHTEPLEPDGLTTLSQIALVSAPDPLNALGRMVTGADLHPNGLFVALRVYSGLYEYRLSTLDLSEMSQVSPLFVAPSPAGEPQGEAVAYGLDGLGLWTASEVVDGFEEQLLHHYPCAGASVP